MRQKVLRGVAWVLGETFGRNVLLLLFTVALARLLTPTDFGVVATLSLFVGIASTLAEGGLGAALIQAKDPTQQDISTLFWAQLLLAFVLAGALAAVGPSLAAIFHLPILQPLTLAFALNILLSAPASIQYSLFYKQLNIKPTTVIALSSQIIGGLVAIALALTGAGPWAVVSQTLAATIVTTIMLWLYSDWRPSFTFSMSSFRKFAGFGFSGVGIALLFEVELRVGSLVIGLFSNPASTGLYQRATSLQLIMVRLMSGVVTRIAFPTFAALRDEKLRLIRALREAAFVNFSVTALAMWCIALLARPLVYFLLGPQWMPSAPVLQALCLSAGFYPVYAIFSKALRAADHPQIVLYQHMARALSMCIVVWIFAASGFATMAWAQAALLIALLPIGCLAVARHIGYRLADQMRDMWPILASGANMWAIGLALDAYMQTQGTITRIIVVGAVVVSVYLATMALLLRLVRNEAWELARTTIMSNFVKPSYNEKVI